MSSSFSGNLKSTTVISFSNSVGTFNIGDKKITLFRVNFNVPREAKEGIVYIKELSFHVENQERIIDYYNSLKKDK